MNLWGVKKEYSNFYLIFILYEWNYDLLKFEMTYIKFHYLHY